MSCNVQPTSEHAWLASLVGEWTCQSECSMGPDQPPMRTEGCETAGMLGDYWLQINGTGHGADGRWDYVMTLGFEPARGLFVGTFITDMMPSLWVYEGRLVDGCLRLETEGPAFGGEGRARYQDEIALLPDGSRTLTSFLLADNGERTPFMQASLRRKI